MKTLLIILSLGIAVTAAQAHDYEVKYRLVRRGMENQKLEGYEVGISKAKEGSDFSEVRTYPTDSQGLGVAKFKCDRSSVFLHFKLLNKPGWYVYAHGTYPGGADDIPHPAKPIPDESVEALVAFPEEELHEVYLEAIAQGKTHLIASAVKTAALEAPPGAAGASDPLIAKLSDDMKVSEPGVRTLLQKWDEKLQQTEDNARLDEKMLAALRKGDVKEAWKFVKAATQLSLADQKKLLVMPDKNWLLGAMFAVVTKAKAAGTQYPNANVDVLLDSIKKEIIAQIPTIQNINPKIRLDPNISNRLNQIIRGR